ncbi:MFS transporter [Conexibacter sp. CPCC 206217]|uniref:MFS transporter n=1 Tax=Conexibacter sp. CPCC 206217 TaxID=3064574 RepID=UPI00272162FF|nr:MFS transporter [Conexibacter sp. CPCC 206217]MDO8211021.1 MFS transporter [Conexibacter sp. CPCC 206217]
MYVKTVNTIRPGPAGSGLFLGVLLGCQLMLVMDVSVVTTALPSIREGLGLSTEGLSWVQNAYTLAFGGLLLLGARMGDRVGRRRALRGGTGLFGVASLAAGAAWGPGPLLAARAAQGVGAALAAPSVLAFISTGIAESARRQRAVGLYSAVAGAGSSVGLVLGGVAATWPSWRAGLLVNVPVCVGVVALAPRCLPETGRGRGRLDIAGAIVATAAVGSIVFGLVWAAGHGWGHPTAIAPLGLGVVLVVAFAAIEVRAEQPITPPRLFASRRRSMAYLARLLLVGGLFPLFFFLAQLLEGSMGFAALAAGAGYLPMTTTMFAGARSAPRLVRRVGERPVLVGGLLLATLAMAWLGRLGPGATYLGSVVIPTALVGAGVGVAFTVLTGAGMSGVDGRDAGAAAGLVNVAHQLGGTLGLAILVTVFAAARPDVASGSEELTPAIGAALTGSAVLLALALLAALACPPTTARTGVTPR